MARLNIKNAPLLSNIIGTEKIPTGTRGDYTITPDLLATYFTAKLPFATKQELSQLKTNLENQIVTVETILSQSITLLSQRVSNIETEMVGFTQDLTLHKADQSNPHNVTKQQVGLGSVDNTSDVNKPISNATKAYVDSISNNLKLGLPVKYSDSVNSIFGGYVIGSTLLLEDGITEVVSIVDNNTANPNNDMTGWVLKPKKIKAGEVYDQSGKTQQEINNYVVYAEKYGSSLNEAMRVINTEFSGKRVRVYVPSDFPITATVNLNIDCDLELSTLQIKNDVDVIFEPMVNWNGSTTPCDVFCNNKSVRLGWNFDKDLGVISLNKCRFLDIGNVTAQTSASLFCGFYIKNSGIKRLDLYNPTTINSYVKPNGVIGDGAGVNRNIILTGNVSNSDTVSDINIYDPIAINLIPEEDADAIAINLGTGTASGKVFNIDIYNAYSQNCQKRLIKIQTGQQEKYITGVRLHGSIVGIGGGVMPYCCLDVYGKVIVEANGTLNAKGWLLGMQLADGAILKGDLKAFVEMGEVTHISGNTVRALNQVSTQGTTVDISEISGVGGGELFANNAGHSLTLNRAKHVGYLRNFSSAGSLDVKFMELEFKDPTVIPTRATYIFSLSGTAKKYINSMTLKSTIATALNYAGRFIATADVEINELKIDGVFNTAGIELASCSNTKIRKGRVTQALSLVRATGAGGANILLDQCKIPTGGTVVFADAGSPKVTNIVELNPINF